MQTMNDQFTIEARQTVIDEDERRRRLAICFGILLDGVPLGETAVKTTATPQAGDDLATDEATTKKAPK